MIPIIEGDIRDAKCVAGGIPFTNLDHLTDGTLVPGNPDIYYGARPEQLARRVRNELSGHIIPSTQEDFYYANPAKIRPLLDTLTEKGLPLLSVQSLCTT